MITSENKSSLQYAIYIMLNDEYTKFDEPEYSDKTEGRKYETPFEILDKLKYA